MIKRNVISGLLLFSLSILLGPYMTVVLRGSAEAPKAEYTASLQALESARKAYQDEGGESEPGAAAANLAAASSQVLVAKAALEKTQTFMGHVRSSHAHGNLEGILNIVVGLFLGLVAVSTRVRAAISWLFVAGSWSHGGFLVLSKYGLVFLLPFVKFGALILLAGLFSLVASVLMKGFREA